MIVKSILFLSLKSMEVNWVKFCQESVSGFISRVLSGKKQIIPFAGVCFCVCFLSQYDAAL